MISKIFVSSLKGEILVSEKFRPEDITDWAEEYFMSLLKKENHLPPHMDKDGYRFHHMLKDGLCFVTMTKMGSQTKISNLYSLQCTELLVRFYTLCKDLCGIVSEESIRLNSLSIQELLMDFMDFGYPQILKADKLKPYLHSKPTIFKDPTKNTATSSSMVTSLSIPQDPLSLFGENKNASEVFLDVLEDLSVLVDKEGRLLHAEVAGNVQLKCFLKEKPGIKIAFNKDLKITSEKSAGALGQVILDSCNFHESVNLDTFAKDRAVTINPQCGNVFSVCTYNIRQSFGIPIPFRLLYTITEGHNSKDLELNLVLRCELPYNTQALNVVGTLPVPNSTTGILSALSGQVQTVEHITAKSQIIWKIKSFPGATEAVANFKLVEGNRGNGSKLAVGPLALTFELSGLAVSGLKIRFFHTDSRNVEKPVIWVRYITIGNSYLLRLN